MKKILRLPIFLFVSLASACTNHDAAPTANKAELKQIAAFSVVIGNIHSDLLQLQNTHAWLSGYSNKCLMGGGSLFFMPKPMDLDSQSQQPDQLYVGSVPVDQKKGFKYDNDVETVPACQFPSLGVKVYASIVVRGKENSKCAEAIRQSIIRRCEEMQRQMTK